MNEASEVNALLIMLVGGSIVAAALIKGVFARIGVPALVGYIGLGLLLRSGDQLWGILNSHTLAAFEFLASVGIVALLFKVGMESHPRALAGKLPSAAIVWLGNMIVAGIVGFSVSYWLLGLGLVPSAVIGVALTATSVGVAVGAWEEANALQSASGRLMVDIAELDDISGIALMALVLAVIPVLQTGDGILWGPVGTTAVEFVVTFAAFAALCYLFAHYVESGLTRMAARFEALPGRMLTVVGIGMIIAAAAGWLGFSLAIGALFAGLVFSTDPEALKTESSFIDLYEFFTPFFFIGIGLQMDPTIMVPALGMGAVLLIGAIMGKLVGTALPAMLVTGKGEAWLLGVSMVPRAEIAMVIIYEARQLGQTVVSDVVYGAMAVVSVGTCLISPLWLRGLFSRVSLG